MVTFVEKHGVNKNCEIRKKASLYLNFNNFTCCFK